MIFGVATEIVDLHEKAVALAAVPLSTSCRVAPPRCAPVTEQELRGTTVLALPVVEALAKVRTGPPVDDVEDLSLPVWLVSSRSPRRPAPR